MTDTPAIETLVIAVCPECGRYGLRARPGRCVGRRRNACLRIAARRAERAERTRQFRKTHVRRGKRWLTKAAARKASR